MVDLIADEMARIRNVQRENIVPAPDERGILLVAVDEIPGVGKDLSEDGPAGVDAAAGGSGESDGEFHETEKLNDESERPMLSIPRDMRNEYLSLMPNKHP
jgi:hypothetical protein